MKKSDCEKFEVQVCQKTFLNILQISRDRVTRIAKRHLEAGTLPRENRGGDSTSKKFDEQRTAVRKFIESLKGVESHYCRSKVDSRQYLPCDLNISKLLKMYNDSCDQALTVKRSFFHSIFSKEYNIGFGSPVTDACSKCIELTEKIKSEKDREKKTTLMIEKRIHKLRANAFFQKLKDIEDKMVTFSFDCQKNLVNPKIPDQASYYSRQLYTYNFTIVQGSSKSKMSPKNIFIYTWMEHQHKKGSNEIASAVFHRLSETDLSAYSTIRLCADGCGGQNRNSTMIGMCSYFLFNIAPLNIQSVELVFPVPGHSFLPPDRVFGRIEKQLKKEVTITDPERYINIFKTHGTVMELGKDCVVKDWTTHVGEFFKPVSSWLLKFSLAKLFIITKNQNNNIVLRGELYYNSDIDVSKSILKKGKKLHTFRAETVPVGVPPNPMKLKDVKNILLNISEMSGKNAAI